MANKRVVYFDVLNTIACLCVLGMHCNGIVHTYEDSLAWRQSLVVESLAYWAVPVFFMLSGATLMNYRKRYSTAEFLKKRFQKVFIPFVIWSVGVGIYKYSTGALVIKGKRDFIELFLNNRIENVYWFFIPLFLIYLSLPVLSKLAEDKKVLNYMAAITIATWVVMPFACGVLKLDYSNALKLPVAAEYVVYVIVGYLISITPLKLPVRIIIYIAGIGGFLVRFLHTLIVSAQVGWVHKLTWGYYSLPAFTLAVAIFVFIKYFTERFISDTSVVAKVFKWCSGVTFGIYLCHIYIRNILMSVFNATGYDLWWRLAGPLILFAVCLVVVKLIQKIPFIGKYVIPS